MWRTIAVANHRWQHNCCRTATAHLSLAKRPVELASVDVLGKIGVGTEPTESMNGQKAIKGAKDTVKYRLDR